jgi:hypothetical protein
MAEITGSLEKNCVPQIGVDFMRRPDERAEPRVTRAEDAPREAQHKQAGDLIACRNMDPLDFVSRRKGGDEEGDDPEGRTPKYLYIDVLVSLPELTDGTATPETVAPSFRHMLIERDEKAPVCRLRLEARWEDDGTVEGEVSQELFWVDTLDDDPPLDKRHPVSVADRGLIQLYYTPASGA